MRLLHILTTGRKNVGPTSSDVHLSIPLNFTYIKMTTKLE